MMTLIADCGSTKTDWALVDAAGDADYFASPGMNATIMAPEELRGKIREAISDRVDCDAVGRVFFYAAGCRTAAHRENIADTFGAILPVARVAVESDLLGAARALCMHDAGIACIMGTGSNCCEYSPYNGGVITASVPPLGYVLGDEGSGSAIGKALVSDALKGLLPRRLVASLLDFAGMDADGIIAATYRGEAPNRFLAGFARFASANIGQPEIAAIVDRCIGAFFDRNVMQLPGCRELPVNLTGSIACTFNDRVSEVCARNGLRCGIFVKRPIERLVEFHRSNRCRD